MLGGPLYAVGGHDGWGYLNTVERWDTQTKQWSYVGNLQNQRSTCGVAALNGRSVVSSLPPHPTPPASIAAQGESAG